jgi:RecA/RadA recombinase
MARIGQQKHYSLITCCKQIDELLERGLLAGELTLIYGKRGTGKTHVAMRCSYQCAKRELKVIFIDSNNTFSSNRLVTIAGKELDAISPYIFICKPQTFEEQSRLLANLGSYNLGSVALIVLDAITTLYRLKLSEKTIFKLNMELNWQLAYLKELAKIYNIPILITSSVNIINQNKLEKKIQLIAKRVIEFWTQNSIYLENDPKKKGGKRYFL